MWPQPLDVVIATVSMLQLRHVLVQCPRPRESTRDSVVSSMAAVQVMAKPQNLPYNRADILRAFQMFCRPSDPAGHIHPDDLEQALVSSIPDALPMPDAHMCAPEQYPSYI